MPPPLHHLAAALRGFAEPGPRLVDEMECVASVLLAIAAAHAIGAQNVAWSAFTGFVLMRGHVAETLARGLMRIVGTVAGAALAVAVLPMALRSVPAAALLAGTVGAVGLYGMLAGKRGYAWLLFGITFELVLLDTLERPTIDAGAFARTRVLEVVAGTAACVAVSLVSTLTARRRWPAASAPAPARVGWHPQAARHAAQAGLALALLPPLHAAWGLAELEGAAVTIMAVMIVPVAGIGASGLQPVTRRLLHRTVGCLAGGAFALVALLAAGGSPVPLVAGTALGVAMGRHVENSGSAYTYAGLQFALSVIVALVPDSYAEAAIVPALLRLASILAGMAILEPILLGWHAVAARQPGAAGSGGGGDAGE